MANDDFQCRYIIVTGGVLSGVGKGVLASSIGVCLRSSGSSPTDSFRVTHIKVDPYINIDAGCMSPYEHGEVFVLDDGGETDMDLGNYERFTDVTLTSDHNLTTGKIYLHVIQAERKGEYLGRTVQVVPHISNAIQEWIERVAAIPVDGSGLRPQVCIVELGGTIGDIESMPFVEAMRQFQFRLGPERVQVLHVALVPTIGKEQKTKPLQHSVKEMRALGLLPDMIVCRSTAPIEPGARAKIALFSQVPESRVFSVYDVANLYEVPGVLEDCALTATLLDRLRLCTAPVASSAFPLARWRRMAHIMETTTETVHIAMVGKYTDSSSDTYHSVVKALQHAAFACRRKLELVFLDAELLEPGAEAVNPRGYHDTWRQLCSAAGVVVPGGFGVRGWEGKVRCAQWCREKRIPYLGICLGLQVAAVEFARNVLGVTGANSQEMDERISPAQAVVIYMPEVSRSHMGGTMRLGARETVITAPDSLAARLYNTTGSVMERHRHRYEVNPAHVPALEAAGMVFSGHDTEGNRMEFLELRNHPFFFAAQAHPEFKSRPLRPSPPFVGLLLAASGQLDVLESGPPEEWGVSSIFNMALPSRASSPAPTASAVPSAFVAGSASLSTSGSPKPAASTTPSSAVVRGSAAVQTAAASPSRSGGPSSPSAPSRGGV